MLVFFVVIFIVVVVIIIVGVIKHISRDQCALQ